jgi:hypothetical protein
MQTLEAMKAYIDAELQKKTKSETTPKTVVATSDELTAIGEENGDRENSADAHPSRSYSIDMSD